MQMSTLSLSKVECNDQQEGNGDEIYFTFEDTGGLGTGETNLISGMNTGDSRNLTDKFNFSGTALVRMFESDPWPNPDDGISCTYVDQDKMVFAGADVSYTLFYDVA
jgi:hypothetical protein